MISLEEFCDFLLRFKHREERQNEFADAFETLFDGSTCIHVVDDSLPLDILRAFFNDTDDWIGYFIWDLEYGARWNLDSITDKNGNPVPLQTAEDLYNLLIKNMEESK